MVEEQQEKPRSRRLAEALAKRLDRSSSPMGDQWALLTPEKKAEHVDEWAEMFHTLDVHTLRVGFSPNSLAVQVAPGVIWEPK